MHLQREHLTPLVSLNDQKEPALPSESKYTHTISESRPNCSSDTILYVSVLYFSFALDDALNFSRLAAKSLSQDEFSLCFEPKDVRDISTLSGNFKTLLPTAILTLCYICGIFIRYCILFPMRCCFSAY